MSDHLQVIGGAGGVEAKYDDLAAAARVLQDAAQELVQVAWSTRGVLGDGGLLASAVLDPGGFARVEAAVLAADFGPHGLVRAAGELELTALRLQAAVAAYQVADRLGDGVREIRQWTEVMAGGAVFAAMLVSPAGGDAVQWARDGGAARFLADHPGVAEDIAGGTPAVLQGIAVAVAPSVAGAPAPGFAPERPMAPGALEQVAGWLGALYPAGSPVVLGRGTDAAAPAAPRNVTDLIAGLEHRDAMATGADQGEIDVRRLTWIAADGTTRTSWVVDLPGTKSWEPDPRHREHLNDLATNLTTMAGTSTARIDGLTEVLARAGVGRDDPVMLVGHSQGGLVAMRAAERYAADGSFRVTHVVTAGSPIARMAVPPSVSVLSLENRYDLVPRLDGEPPPPQPNRVTIVFDAQTHDIGSNHALDTTYLPGARDVDCDRADPSLAAWRVGAAAFLPPDATRVTASTTVWDIRNGG